MPRDHWNRFKATPLIERLMEKISFEPFSGCWLWMGYLNDEGYGRLRLGSTEEPYSPAHKASYELLVGPVPEDLQLDHLCRVRCCVNPKHLEPVTALENTTRGIGNGPAVAAAALAHEAITHCPQGHEYTPENTRRYGVAQARWCWTCKKARDREAQRNRRALKKAA